MGSEYAAERLAAETTRALLRVLHRGGQVVLTELFSRLWTDSSNHPSPVQVRRLAYNLKQRGLLSGNARHGYRLTKRGLGHLNMLQLNQLRQEQPWDFHWRMVIFDIPEDKRAARDAVRRLLKKLGFYRLQQSVWIHPLPCLEQFNSIRTAYGINQDILLLEVKHSDEQLTILEHFRNEYPKL
jgi:CRISPR-associated endonuclease Cas2